MEPKPIIHLNIAHSKRNGPSRADSPHPSPKTYAAPRFVGALKGFDL